MEFVITITEPAHAVRPRGAYDDIVIRKRVTIYRHGAHQLRHTITSTSMGHRMIHGEHGQPRCCFYLTGLMRELRVQASCATHQICLPLLSQRTMAQLTPTQ